MLFVLWRKKGHENVLIQILFFWYFPIKEASLLDGFVNMILRLFLPPTITPKTEKLLKNIALLLGLLSAIAIIFDLYPLTMFLSFPFCMIWIYCAWLHQEPQLKWINLIFCWFIYLGLRVIFLQQLYDVIRQENLGFIRGPLGEGCFINVQRFTACWYRQMDCHYFSINWLWHDRFEPCSL